MADDRRRLVGALRARGSRLARRARAAAAVAGSPVPVRELGGTARAQASRAPGAGGDPSALGGGARRDRRGDELAPTAAVAACLPIALHILAASRSLSRHGVPRRAGASLALQGIRESGAGLGRAATMLGPVPLAAALVHPRTRTAARALARPGARRAVLALALASPTRDYRRLRPRLDPLRFAALSVADDVAYGAGVWRGCADERTIAPVRPSWRPGAGLAGSPIRPNG